MRRHCFSSTARPELRRCNIIAKFLLNNRGNSDLEETEMQHFGYISVIQESKCNFREGDELVYSIIFWSNRDFSRQTYKSKI